MTPILNIVWFDILLQNGRNRLYSACVQNKIFVSNGIQVRKFLKRVNIQGGNITVLLLAKAIFGIKHNIHWNIWHVLSSFFFIFQEKRANSIGYSVPLRFIPDIAVTVIINFFLLHYIYWEIVIKTSCVSFGPTPHSKLKQAQCNFYKVSSVLGLFVAKKFFFGEMQIIFISWFNSLFISLIDVTLVYIKIHGFGIPLER